MADIVLVNPRFQVSYWGLEHALPLLGKRGNLPTACLPLLAALTPAEPSVTLVDENVEAIDYDRLARADIVGLTGMSVQRARMLEILARAENPRRLHGRRRSVGERAGRLLRRPGRRDLRRRGRRRPGRSFSKNGHEGRHQRRYEQAERTDMTQVPVPRYDLLKTQGTICSAASNSAAAARSSASFATSSSRSAAGRG